MGELNRESNLNTLIVDYTLSLKQPNLSNERKQTIEKFKTINDFLEKNSLYKYNKDLLDSQTLKFIDERNIKIIFERTINIDTPKSKLYGFENSHDQKHLQKIIIQKLKGEKKISDLILIIEEELPKNIGISIADYKRLTKNRNNFIKVKKLLFMELLEETDGLNNQYILKRLHATKLNFKDLESLLEFFTTSLKETNIKPLSFIMSILETKEDREKLKKII